MNSIENTDFDFFDISTTIEPIEYLDELSMLGKIYFQLAILWFVITLIGIRCRFLGYGESGNEFTQKERIHISLSSIVNSKSYKYRSKCNYYCYKQYLRYQMVSMVKSLVSYVLTMVSLFELPHLDWSIIFAAIASCIIACIAMMIRYFNLSVYYPLNKSVYSVANEHMHTFDEQIIPYLVHEKTSGHWIPTYMALPTTCIGIYIIYLHNPSSSVTIKLVISMALSLLFALKRTYSEIKFYCKTYKLLQIMSDTKIFNAYNVYIQMKELYDTNVVNDITEYNPFEIAVNVIGFGIMLYFFMISILCSYEYYHDSISKPFCSKEGVHSFFIPILVFVSTLMSVLIAFLLCLKSSRNRKASCILPIYWTVLTLIMMIFGSICVYQHGDRTNQYCGPVGFVGGVLMVSFGSSCCCGFWCCVCLGSYSNENKRNADRSRGLLLSTSPVDHVSEPSNAPVCQGNIENIHININK